MKRTKTEKTTSFDREDNSANLDLETDEGLQNLESHLKLAAVDVYRYNLLLSSGVTRGGKQGHIPPGEFFREKR